MVANNDLMSKLSSQQHLLNGHSSTEFVTWSVCDAFTIVTDGDFMPKLHKPKILKID